MTSELSKEFEKDFRLYKKELKKIVNEVNYPYIKAIFDLNISVIKDYPNRELKYKRMGIN